ncbi:hypothetical protein ACM257_21215 [Alteromonas macleodii]|jgi:hypothetical protein|uniref:hypothetical protein n=1 Tax=Alteromonas TaxID=226 RepID=UPI000BDAD0DC|nr:hypothetical protein [Alteromonas macleodii]OZC00329.1 hypothetical protein BBP29_13080 [Alteromonas macleodii]|tara:strand:- start:600 stop:1034 length:435 start_codon:yes stop_codon:yes gene_type:complete
MNIKQAAHFSLITLSHQIKLAGGAFNSKTKAVPIQDTFQTLYIFETDNGMKGLLSRDEFSVVTFNAGGLFNVSYLNESGEYTLRQIAISDDGKKNFMNPTFLTSDFDELESVLKEKFPSIVFRYLPNPVEKIFSDGDSVNKYTN